MEKQGSRKKKKHLRYNTVPSVAPSAVLNLTLPVDSDSKPVEHCISVSNEHSCLKLHMAHAEYLKYNRPGQYSNFSHVK